MKEIEENSFNAQEMQGYDQKSKKKKIEREVSTKRKEIEENSFEAQQIHKKSKGNRETNLNNKRESFRRKFQ